MHAPLFATARLDREALPASDFVATRESVDVWCIELGRVAESRLAALSEPERARAQRQAAARSDRNAATFAPGRAALRAILALYLDEPAADVELAIGEHERPVLGGAAPAGLDFNLSHSGERALLAVSLGRRVGIDLESLDASRNVLALARRFFTDVERDRVLAAPEPVRAFYRIWTCKEAYLKAIGTGLARSPRSFEVTLGSEPGSRVAELRDAERPVSSRDSVNKIDSNVLLCELPTVGEQVAGLCVIGSAASCRVFDAAELVT